MPQRHSKRSIQRSAVRSVYLESGLLAGLIVAAMLPLARWRAGARGAGTKAFSAAGGGPAGLTSQRSWSDENAETQVTFDLSGLIGGRLPGGFVALGMNAGVTTSGRVIIQLQATVLGGAGLYMDWGGGIGITRSVATTTGVSGSGAFVGSVNGGVGVTSGGASEAVDLDGHLATTLSAKIGVGFGAMAGVGFAGTTTLASPPVESIRRVVQSCR